MGVLISRQGGNQRVEVGSTAVGGLVQVILYPLACLCPQKSCPTVQVAPQATVITRPSTEERLSSSVGAATRRTCSAALRRSRRSGRIGFCAWPARRMPAPTAGNQRRR